MKPMTKWQRVEAAVHGDDVDRIPMTFWRHHAVQEWSPRSLAELTLGQYHKYDLDIIKLTPTGIYPTQDWGPTIRFSTDDSVHPKFVDAAVRSADEWAALRKLDINSGALGRELEAIRLLKAGLDEDVPIVMTVYSPLTIALMLCLSATSVDRVVQDLRESPQELHAGLATICDVVREYVLACLQAGASGIFMASMMANFDDLTQSEYEEFGTTYDLPILEAVVGRSRLTMLHACRQNVMFDLIAKYPVDVIHWNDRVNNSPSLSEARERTEKALSGGVATNTLLYGTTEDVVLEVQDSIAQTNGSGFILTPTCTANGRVPEENLKAMRQAVNDAGS